MTEQLVVVGGDAAGMAAASEVRRRRPDIDIVALERGAWTSYSACGIPYLVGGEVGGLDELVARTPTEFQRRGIDARTGHEAVELDLDAHKVHVRDVTRGETYTLGFDLLQLATGARPMRPPVPGVDGPNVYGVQTLTDASALLATVTTEPPRRVCVIGSGYIGLELAEAFIRRGADVTVVERRSEVMSTLDPDMGALVRQAMEGLGVHVRLGEHLLTVEEDRVVTSSEAIPADLVVLGTGVEPEVSLAEGAALPIGPSGALAVDRQQRTSAEGVFAAGDCCESFHLVARRPVHIPLGTHANKQGRVAGINLAGGYATFPGVVGTAVTKICHAEVGRTGLGEQEAIGAGFRVFAATTTATTAAGYLAEATETTVKVIAEHGSGRLLGTQIVGGSGSAKRVDVAATALMAGMTLEQVLHLDLGYAPPFSPVWDPFLVAVRRALGQIG